MGVRAENDPFGGPDIYVDSILGSAYKTVRFVAVNMDAIIEVANSIPDVALVAETVKNRTADLYGSLEPNGQVLLPYPSGLNQDNISNFTTIIRGTDNYIYPETPANFHSLLAVSGLLVTLNLGHPSTLSLGSVRAVLTYRVK